METLSLALIQTHSKCCALKCCPFLDLCVCVWGDNMYTKRNQRIWMWSCNRRMCEWVAVLAEEWTVVCPYLEVSMQGMAVKYWLVVQVHGCKSILGLVLGEQVEVFAQWAGELRHLFAAMVWGAWSVTLSLLDTSIDLQTKVPRIF